MSTNTGDRSPSQSQSQSSGFTLDVDSSVSPRAFRALALVGVVVLTISYVSVLQGVTAVVGGTQQLLTVVVLMLAGATVLAHTIRPRTAAVLALATGGLGFAYYLTVTGLGVGAVFSATDRLLSDSIALLTGLELLRMVEAGVWTLGFVPGPVFLSWYFALRRRYVLSVATGGGALLFLVLTGDAIGVVPLLGTIGAIAAVGFGELEHRRGTIVQADVLAILFAAMIVVSLSVTFVPGGTPGPTFFVESDHDGTLEGSLTSSQDRAYISGSVELSPEVRFTVRSEDPSYWRTGIYDRFTGDSWIRTGQEQPYDGSLAGPPGESDTVRQTVFVETDLGAMPTAPHPIDVEGDIRENTMVTTQGQFQPDDPLIEGDTYNVESAVVNASEDDLREAGTDYPDEVVDSFLQTTESTSSEFEEATAEIVADADADNPHDKAVAIESHLRTSKEYSLNVTRPDGNVAEAFLLEMDEGYCVYFATSMVQMLRAEDVPARYVTGYTTGQQVDDNEWVVRGLDAHAWVEVYFPDHGWVAFEPTPGSDRDEVHDDRLEDAREDGESDVDTDSSEAVPVTEDESDAPSVEDGGLEDEGNVTDETNQSPEGNQTPDRLDPSHPDFGPSQDGLDYEQRPGGVPGPEDFEQDYAGSGAVNENVTNDEDDGDETEESPLTATENLALGFALFVGLVAGAHRTGATARVSRETRLHWNGLERTPTDDAERAYERLELLLERRYRARKPTESPRQYLSSLSRFRSLDSRVYSVTEIHEQARYGGGVDRETADEAVDLVDAMVRGRLPVVGRLWR